MKTITRRTALAVPVTLPLLPVSAFATPAERDPVVEAYRTWLAAYDANDAFLAADHDGHSPEGKVLYDRVSLSPFPSPVGLQLPPSPRTPPRSQRGREEVAA